MQTQIAKNIIWLMQQGGLNPSTLAMESRVPQPTIHRIIKGDHADPRTSTLEPLARYFKISVSELREVDLASRNVAPGDRLPADGIVDAPNYFKDEEEYPSITRIVPKISAGISGYAVADMDAALDERPMYFHKSWYANKGYKPDQLRALRVSGASMEPGLQSGDTVVINMADKKPTDGAVFALLFEGELAVKRLLKIGDEWVAASDNPDKNRYRDKPLNGGSQVLGKVIHKQSESI